MSEKQCFVYLMESDAPVWPDRFVVKEHYSVFKVGISSSPYARLCELQTASPYLINISAKWVFQSRRSAIAIEGKFHAEHSHIRMSGEWFYGDSLGAVLSMDRMILRYLVRTMNIRPVQAADILDRMSENPSGYALDVVASEYGEAGFA